MALFELYVDVGKCVLAVVGNFTNELYKETIQIARITITAIKMITVIVFIFLGYGCKHTN